jgi:hypothetical protein
MTHKTFSPRYPSFYHLYCGLLSVGKKSIIAYCKRMNVRNSRQVSPAGNSQLPIGEEDSMTEMTETNGELKKLGKKQLAHSLGRPF